MADAPSIELQSLLARLPGSTHARHADAHARITAIETDSRAVRPDALFVALRGEHGDGHAFVAQAIANGAAAVIVQRDAPYPLPPSRDAAVITVDDCGRALSAVAAALFAEPSQALDVVGVTGTNGKTTTVAMVHAIADAAGVACGTIGTTGAAFGGRYWELAHTTPLPPQLHGLLAAMRDAGCAIVAMEVSSHALALHRVDDVRFRAAALTNVARDHLDFHQTTQAYAGAKRRLFELAQACALNLDDAYGRAWEPELRARGVPVTTYGENAQADVVATAVTVTADGSRFIAGGQAYELRLTGRFNVGNALAAICLGRFLGIDDGSIARGLGQLERVPGRMERITADGVNVVVDYAHTPDALEHALSAVRETTRGTLTVVFGCGGDRDRGKRPLMGAIAAGYADRIYVTTDNPRSEDPQAIVDEIVAGIGAHPYVVDLDRRSAVERAIAQARSGDAVLIAGKGHETYQIVGNEVFDFDDAAVARQFLQRRNVMR